MKIKEDEKRNTTPSTADFLATQETDRTFRQISAKVSTTGSDYTCERQGFLAVSLISKNHQKSSASRFMSKASVVITLTAPRRAPRREKNIRHNDSKILLVHMENDV